MARILVVDDSKIYREKIKQMLRDTEHEVIGEAEDGMEAIKLYKELKPDMTTLDMTMPKLDGMGVLKWIMESDPSAVVIVVSSSAQRKKVLEATELGAAAFLAKPFESMALLDTIAKILSDQSEGLDMEINLDDFDFDDLNFDL